MINQNRKQKFHVSEWDRRTCDAIKYTVYIAGHIIQTQYNSIDVENNIIVNNTTVYGTLELSFNRKISNSYFLITISALAYRP